MTIVLYSWSIPISVLLAHTKGQVSRDFCKMWKAEGHGWESLCRIFSYRTLLLSASMLYLHWPHASLRHLIASVHGVISARCSIQTQPSSPGFSCLLLFVTKKKANNSIQSTFSVSPFHCCSQAVCASACSSCSSQDLGKGTVIAWEYWDNGRRWQVLCSGKDSWPMKEESKIPEREIDL